MRTMKLPFANVIGAFGSGFGDDAVVAGGPASVVAGAPARRFGRVGVNFRRGRLCRSVRRCPTRDLRLATCRAGGRRGWPIRGNGERRVRNLDLDAVHVQQVEEIAKIPLPLLRAVEHPRSRSLIRGLRDRALA